MLLGRSGLRFFTATLFSPILTNILFKILLKLLFNYSAQAMEVYMVILALGDVVGSGGCEFLRKSLSNIKKENNVELVIVNGENSADGNGITPYSAEHLFTSGVDVITTGNHVFRRREVYNLLDENPRLLRPANFSTAAPGRGYCIIDTGRVVVCVINLIGTVFMDSYDNPFLTADAILKEVGTNLITIVDFHAEATSEKKAMGYYLDGRVSAVFGTHTHVLTADEQILPKGTGYITDIGMTGSINSVLGVEPSNSIQRFTTKMPVKFINASSPFLLTGVIFDINNKTMSVNTVKTLQIRK
jgi:metallophosphoesterase (TIGR00282 family)